LPKQRPSLREVRLRERYFNSGDGPSEISIETLAAMMFARKSRFEADCKYSGLGPFNAVRIKRMLIKNSQFEDGIHEIR